MCCQVLGGYVPSLVFKKNHVLPHVMDFMSNSCNHVTKEEIIVQVLWRQQIRKISYKLYAYIESYFTIVSISICVLRW